MIKNSRKLFGLLMLAIFVSFMGCSKEGPAGPAGTNGTNGTNGTAICGACHSAAATDVNLKFSQFDLSKHDNGIIFEEEAGRTGCGACHTGMGFQEAVATGKDDATSMATGKISCNTCHIIHTKFDSTDFALRYKDPVKLRQTGVTVDLKNGNLCVRCHQARVYARTTPDTIKAASSSSTYSRFGPHYGVISNVVTMNGPVQIAGSVAYPTSNPHTTLAKGCISCHMGNDPANPAVGGHSFLMPKANLAKIAACTTCHDATTISTAPKAAQNAKDLATYRRILITKGMLDTSQALTGDPAEPYNVLGEYFATPGGKTKVYTNPDDVSVVLNYLYLAKEKSNGVHNPAYVQALIKNGLEYLNK